MKSTNSLREFGSLIGRTTKNLQRRVRKGIFKAHRSITDRPYHIYCNRAFAQGGIGENAITVCITGQKAKKRWLVTYCRVSSTGKKKDLISQKNAVESFCLAAGKIIDERLEDTGPVLNYKRKHFVQLMEMAKDNENCQA